MYSAPLNDGQWHHVCVRWKNNGKWTFYVDGFGRISGDALAENHVIKGKGRFVIGQSQLSFGGSFDAAGSFVGEISQVNVWESALDKATVLSTFRNDRTSGYSLDWRDIQAYVIGDTLIKKPSERLGFDQVYFSRTTRDINTYIESTITQPLTAVTVSLWARVSDASDTGLFYYVSGASSFGLRYTAEQRLVFDINGGQGMHSVDPFMDNSWHHICLTWRADTGLARVFLDGALRLEKTNVEAGQTIAASGVFQLGRGKQSSFLGRMTGVNVWDTALSGFVVSAMSKASGKEAGNVISWDSLKTAVARGSVAFQFTSGQVQSKVGSTDYRLKWPTRSTLDRVEYKDKPIPDMTGLTVCFWFNSGNSKPGGVFQYSTVNEETSIQGYMRSHTTFNVALLGYWYYKSIPSLPSSTWKHICLKWSNANGNLHIFFNGELIHSINDLCTGRTIEGNGIFMLGQEMDSHGGGFDSSQAYVGRITNLNVWSSPIKSSLITAMARGCSAFEGDVVSWRHFRKGITGDVLVEEHSVCGYPSYTTQARRDNYCWTSVASNNGIRAMFERGTSGGKLWRCFNPVCQTLDPRGLPMYDVDTSSPSYYTRNGQLRSIVDL